jgi:hypothetical protein
VLKQLTRPEAQAGSLGSGDDLDAEDRVAAEVEEVVLGIDVGSA